MQKRRQSRVNTINLTYEDRVARIELNRPESINSMNVEMLQELSEALEEVKNSTADVLVLSGSGKGFSSGGDIKTMLSNMDPKAFSPVMKLISGIAVTLYTFPKLTISAIHGPAAGLGFSLALACDYVIAHQTATLSMNFIGIGLIPDGGGHFFLARRLGEIKARRLIWNGERLTAESAYDMGLVDRLVRNDLKAEVKGKIEEWLEKPVKALIQTKLIYANQYKSVLESMLAKEHDGQFSMRQTADHQEGIKAFMEKRQPRFTGK
ncbi:enoyl-CoA hydratase [Metabacillus sp. GX 13764]|uniref:enoyl-CoA hydratase n=1 Tax=Metabacillus kandeliae TaxID=2900151 RepID=UPI001E32A1F1|nr:enoyl-CoA hydratase [Metabacillus kandeliae]